MKLSRFGPTGLVVAVVLLTSLISTPAFATSIGGGTANFTGSVNVLGNPATPGSDGIYFYNNAGTVPNVFNPGIGTGSFAGLTSGTIDNLVGPATTGAFSVPQFATFTVAGGTVIDFDLQEIAPGIGTLGACSSNTVGNMCTPFDSPFTLTQTMTGVTVTMSLFGVAYIGSSGSGDTSTEGLFNSSVQVNGGTITGVLAQVESTTGLVGQAYAATFTASPEPEVFSMILTGLSLIALSRRSWFTRK